MRAKNIILALSLAAVLALGSLPAMAQDKPADNMQLDREKIRADKKLFVAENMQFTESEAKAFWPIYEAYQEESGKLWDRMLKLIEGYAKDYQTMSDETAKKLLDDYLGIEADVLKLKKSYLPKFHTVLSEKKVARYYQLENKILAVVNYELAAEIPLVQ